MMLIEGCHSQSTGNSRKRRVRQLPPAMRTPHRQIRIAGAPDGRKRQRSTGHL